MAPAVKNALRSPHLWTALSAAAVVALAVALTVHFLPPSLMFSETILSGGDFSTHMAQNRRFVDGMEQAGRTWVYDPHLLAGFPANTIFDADNKAWEIWNVLAMQLGASFVFGFKTFILAAHALVVPVVYASARLFGLARGPSILAALLGLLLWYFDSFAHWTWWAGMLEYGFACYVLLLPLGLFWRYLEDRKWPVALAAGIALGLAHLWHPYVFFVLAVPMAGLWLIRRRELSRNEHLLVVSVGILCLLINSWWLAVAVSFWHYIMDSAYYGQSGLGFLVTDLLSLLQNAETTGFLGTRTGFRFLYVAAGLAMCVVWQRNGDRRWILFALAVGSALMLTYLGGYTVFEQFQPYRFCLPAAFMATIPAAAFFSHLARSWRDGHVPTLGKTALVVAALPAGQHLASDALYFLPGVPPPVAKLSVGIDPGVGPFGFKPQVDFRHIPLGGTAEVVEWVRTHDDGTARFVVEHASLGDELAWQTNAQVLGGFTHRNLLHSWANYYRRNPQGIDTEANMRAFFRTYAVGHVIISYEDSWFLRVDHPLLEKVASLPGGHHIFRTRIEPDLVATGGGRVSAQINRLSVTGSNPDQDVILRYHFMEHLGCRPDCAVERVPVDEVDPVGFIRIPAPHPPDFQVYNSYEK